MATATATPTPTSTLEHSTRATAEKRLSAAWDAFDNHRPELGSKMVWEAAEVALYQLARKYDYAIDHPDQRIGFAKMLDARNGNARNGSDGYYLSLLILCEYYESNAELGVMPGDDPEFPAPIAAKFINHLLDLIEEAP